MPTSTNRTKWPIGGGAVSIQPGWFPGHSLALIYINMGFDTEPLNYSHTMLPVFQISGPSNLQYNGTFCLPQVPLPSGYTPKVGDNATIQIIETAQHGAALYNVSLPPPHVPKPKPLANTDLTLLPQCADITFAENTDPEIPEVNSKNCFNSTSTGQEIGFQFVYTTTSLSAAYRSVRADPFFSVAVPLLLVAASCLAWL